jgi:hypothetical protein
MKNDTYMVPGEIALAVSTGRTEFISTLINNINAGQQLEVLQQTELLRMLKDMIEDTHRRKAHFNEMKKHVRLFRDFADGINTKAESLHGLIKKAETAEAVEENDHDAPT